MLAAGESPPGVVCTVQECPEVNPEDCEECTKAEIAVARLICTKCISGMQTAIVLAWHALQLPEETIEEVRDKLYRVAAAYRRIDRAISICRRCMDNACATEEDAAWARGYVLRTWPVWINRMFRAQERLLRKLRRMGG
jgi:hypothetical protein